MNPDFEPRLTDEEELLTRWIDNELPAGSEDVEGHLFTSPEMQHEIQAARGLGKILRDGLPDHLEPPHADDFTRRIMNQVDGA